MLGDHRPIEVQVVRIGDGYLAGLPGELFTEYRPGDQRALCASCLCREPGQR